MNHLSSTFRNSSGEDVPFEYWEASGKLYESVAMIVHGLGYRSASYPQLTQYLVSKKFKVYALDLPGHGDRVTPFESVDKAVDDLEIFRRYIAAAEGYREIVVVAHSLGALVALSYPERYPDQRLRIVAVAPLLGGDAVGAKPQAEMYSFEDAVVQRLSADTSFAARISDSGASSVRSAQEKLVSGNARVAGVKTLFVYGQSDEMAPFDAGEPALAALDFATKQLVSFPRMKHDPFSERRRDQVFDAIGAWLDETRFEHKVP